MRVSCALEILTTSESFPPRPSQLDGVAGEASYHSGRFFSDGKRILVCGNEPLHATRCYVQDIAGGEPQPVTTEGTSDGLASPDGKDTFPALRGRYLVYPVGAGTSHKVPWLTADDAVVRWSRDGQSLLVYQPTQVLTHVEPVDPSQQNYC